MKRNLQDAFKVGQTYIKEERAKILVLLVVLLLCLWGIMTLSPQKAVEKGYRLQSKLYDLAFVYQGDLLYGYAVKGTDYWVSDDEIVEVDLKLENYKQQGTFSLGRRDRFQITIHRMDEDLDGKTGKHKTIEKNLFEEFKQEDENLLPVQIDEHVYSQTSSINGRVSHHLKIQVMDKKTGARTDWLYSLSNPGVLQELTGKRNEAYHLPSTYELLPMMSKGKSGQELVNILDYSNERTVYDPETKERRERTELEYALSQNPQLLDKLRLTKDFPQVTKTLKDGGKFYWVNTDLSGMTYLSQLLAETSQTSLFDKWTLPAASAKNFQEQVVTSYGDYLERAFDSSNFSIGVKNELMPFMGQRRADYSDVYWDLRKGNLSIVEQADVQTTGYYSRWTQYLWGAKVLQNAIQPGETNDTEAVLAFLEEELAARQKGEKLAVSPLVTAVYAYARTDSKPNIDYQYGHNERIKKLATEGPSQNVYFVFVTASKSSELSQSATVLDLAKAQPQKLLASSFDDQEIVEDIQTQLDSSLLGNHNFLFLDGESETLVYNPVDTPIYDLQKQANEKLIENNNRVKP